jgi:type VI secretion system activator RovC-like protein
VQNFGTVGGWFFAANPDQSYLEQTIFWAPEVLPTVVPVRPALLAGSHSHVSLDLSELNKGQLRQGPDGWHAVLVLHGFEHRVWLKEAPVVAITYAVELPLDGDFEFPADAGRRLWPALNGGPPGAPLHALSAHRRRQLALALRALDARMDGSTYREIAEVLFDAKRISERDWRTHDLRNRTIRLVRSGFDLMRGGYRALLRPPFRKK